MEEKGHGQNLEATLSQHFAALQKLKNQIARLEKSNKAQGQRPHEGEWRFGDVPGANVENISGCKEESFKEISPDNLLLLGGSTPEMVRAKPTRKVNPKPYSTSQGANQDIRALKMSYLTNQEGLNDEANCYGFYTQERFQANLNRPKIFMEKEIMNFTSQRFLNPSICEYATLEEDSNPKKKRPVPKPIIGVKKSVSYFHKAQYLEKWSRKLKDMIDFPKPAKPVLHLPYLDDPGFTSNQPQE
ncbi:hypothetical protein F2Q69_00045543 [Brassica cretica]|uniref:Uncharacterized protein n=1 Tax=Brassica cretica TaxID=69181 RepID=A0A8S9N4S4_BRACR|nr:hypothetical protein F2Q69_00045543 [Brassica cretica]